MISDTPFIQYSFTWIYNKSRMRGRNLGIVFYMSSQALAVCEGKSYN
jgi:hypothetical protein